MTRWPNPCTEDPSWSAGLRNKSNDLIAGLQRGEWHIEGLAEHGALPQKALFKKLLGLAVEAHASHPAVWSEMGYAGPAYPRGYYRIERGLTDPWEPRRAQNGAGVE